MKFLRKYHKWLGIVLTVFIMLFSISGIILNHRELFAGINVSRNLLPSTYHYDNWNNAAVRGTERLDKNRVLIYGNIGVWVTDNNFTGFEDFNTGFPEGIDNKKISKIHKTAKGKLFAGTHFGLFQYNYSDKMWKKKILPIHEKRITDIIEKGDTLLVLSRSFLLKTDDYMNFTVQTLPEPENYDNKASLFKTLWVIHSGEIYGIAGKIFVDVIAVIFVFLSITGLIYFINPFLIKRKIKKNKGISNIRKSSIWNLKWHNKIGWITIVLLLITTITGMFLRPPLLIPIADSKVGKIPLTILDSENPWFDKLRRINYDQTNDRYFIATIDSIYYSDDDFKSKLKQFEKQPPISIMGVNVFNQIDDENLLIGSFLGLYKWNYKTGYIEDYIDKKKYIKKTSGGGPPIGNYTITGFSDHFKDKEVYFDFNSGAEIINNDSRFVKMPSKIKEQPISLWNVALEFHTARIYKFITGDLYILLIPLFGIFILFILISGFIVWFKKYR